MEGPFVFCVDKESDDVIEKLHVLTKVVMIHGVKKKPGRSTDEFPLKAELLSKAAGSSAQVELLFLASSCRICFSSGVSVVFARWIHTSIKGVE
jgi:hypothetical protein